MRVPALALAIGLTAPVGPFPAAAEEAGITVTGTCTAEAPADRARLTATATRQGQDGTRTATAATTAVNDFSKRVEALKLPDLTLASSGLSTERLTGTANGRPTTTGYRASAGLAVETSSLPGLARVMQEAVAAGMDTISPMDAYLAEATAQRLARDCLPRAMQNARARAEAIASGANAHAGALLSATEQSAGFARPMARAAPMMAMGAAMPAPDLVAAPERVEVTVTATFAILQQR